MRLGTSALATAMILSAYPAGAAIKGDWVNPSKSVILKIGPCGHVLCGTVIWASEKAKHDARKGTNHLVGSHLLTHLQAKGHDSWHGKIFVPDQNMNVSAKLKLVHADQMKVSGCALMICKSQVWTRTHQHHAHHAKT